MTSNDDRKAGRLVTSSQTGRIQEAFLVEARSYDLGCELMLSKGTK